MSQYKKAKILAILGGIITTLVIVICAFSITFNTVIKSKVESSPTDYDISMLPFIRTNLEKLSSGVTLYPMEMDAPTGYVTRFGQHLDENSDIVMFGKKASDFNVTYGEENIDIKLINKMIRRIYIDDTMENIMDFDASLVRQNNRLSQDSEYVISGINIVGLEALEDYNNVYIANELRFAIIGFTKAYLGLLNLDYVEVNDTTQLIGEPSFTLYIPNGKQYEVTYVVDTNLGEVLALKLKANEATGVTE